MTLNSSDDRLDQVIKDLTTWIATDPDSDQGTKWMVGMLKVDRAELVHRYITALSVIAMSQGSGDAG